MGRIYNTAKKQEPKQKHAPPHQWKGEAFGRKKCRLCGKLMGNRRKQKLDQINAQQDEKRPRRR